MLTSTNMVTINPIAGVPGLVRIAEKGRRVSKLEASGQVDRASGTITGEITLANEQCHFVLKLQK